MTPQGSATPSHRANIGYSAVSGPNRDVVGSALPVTPVKKVAAAAIQGANIAEAAHPEESDAIGATYSVTVVDPHAYGSRAALAECGNSLGNGCDGKEGGECKNSGY